MKFEQGYYKDSKVSNYKDYLGKKFNHLYSDLNAQIDFNKEDRILDFGAAVGGLLKEFKDNGFSSLKGTDVSYWAINTGKKCFGLDKELEHFNRNLLTQEWEWVFMFDVLEHIETEELFEIFKLIKEGKVNKGILVRIPVSLKEGEDYVLEISKNDKTHIQRHTKEWWCTLFKEFGFELIMEFEGDSIYSSEGVFTGMFKEINLEENK